MRRDYSSLKLQVARHWIGRNPILAIVAESCALPVKPGEARGSHCPHFVLPSNGALSHLRQTKVQSPKALGQPVSWRILQINGASNIIYMIANTRLLNWLSLELPRWAGTGLRRRWFGGSRCSCRAEQAQGCTHSLFSALGGVADLSQRRVLKILIQ